MESTPAMPNIDVLSNIVVKSAQGSSRTETSASDNAWEYIDLTHRDAAHPLVQSYNEIMDDLESIPFSLPVPTFINTADGEDFQKQQPKKPLKKSVAIDPRQNNESRKKHRSKTLDSGKVKKSRSGASASVLKKLLTSAPASGVRNNNVGAMVEDMSNCPTLLSQIPPSGTVSKMNVKQTEATPVPNSGNLFETCFKYLDTVEERVGALDKSIDCRNGEIARQKQEIARQNQKLCELEAANSQELAERDAARKDIARWKEAFLHRWAPS